MTIDQDTSLAGKVVLITGATDGLGKSVALDLTRRGATVLVHGRDPERIRRTLDEVGAVAANPPRSYQADFSSLDQVRALASQTLDGEPRLDVLVNNAGIGSDVPGGGERQVSADGHELRFAVNYLAPFLLTRLLLPLLRRSAPSRIVNVASLGQAPIDFDDVMLTRDYDGTRAYYQSKLAQIADTVALSEQLAGSGVTVNALHPATYMPTKIVSTPISTLNQGVKPTVRLIADPELDGVTGLFFDGPHESDPDPQAHDPKARALLLDLSNELAGLA